MQVDVYARADEDREQQFLVLPEGQTEMPLPAVGKTWRKMCTVSISEKLPGVPTANVEAAIKFKGFAIIRPEHWSKDWSEISDNELEDMWSPDGWQDKWHLA